MYKYKIPCSCLEISEYHSIMVIKHFITNFLNILLFLKEFFQKLVANGDFAYHEWNIGIEQHQGDNNSCICLQSSKLKSYISYLKALYNGLYQQRNEHGVNRTNQTIDKPNVVPPWPSTINHAKLPNTFKNNTTL